ncbi:MAG: M28 family peptidase [Gemmatimonadaceae bacterium]|nr:M28 family peptidase [Gemmatimonadaceae bacterium]
MRLVLSRVTVRALPLLLVLAACRPTSDPARIVARKVDPAALKRDVAWLSADAREGRRTGTPGNDSAAAFLARRFEKLDLRPLQPGDAFLQPFVAKASSRGGARELPTQNVAAMADGTDPALRGEYIVLGAHFDHLGRESTFATDPQAADAIRNGADDNASGTAVMLELARRFAKKPAKRSVIFVGFSGEEFGLLGSAYWVANPPVPPAQMAAMLNFDMVGRLRDDKLIVYGVATAKELPALVDSANTAALRIAKVPDGEGPSDHSSFYQKKMPVLHFFSDTHDDYHAATDDADKINAAGMVKVADLAERIARRLADGPRLAFTEAPAATRVASRSSGSGVYLGSVPDMAAGEVKGMRLASVRAGSPAELGGLKAGDVIVRFGGVEVTDLYTYTDALNAKKPGDVVEVIVDRGGQRVTLSITLGKRG